MRGGEKNWELLIFTYTPVTAQEVKALSSGCSWSAGHVLFAGKCGGCIMVDLKIWDVKSIGFRFHARNQPCGNFGLYFCIFCPSFSCAECYSKVVCLVGPILRFRLPCSTAHTG